MQLFTELPLSNPAKPISFFELWLKTTTFCFLSLYQIPAKRITCFSQDSGVLTVSLLVTCLQAFYLIFLLKSHDFSSSSLAPASWQLGDLELVCPVVFFFLSNSDKMVLELLLSQSLDCFINEAKNPQPRTQNSPVTVDARNPSLSLWWEEH